MNIVAALMFLCPTAKFHFDGEPGYATLVWDDLYHDKPTMEDLVEAWEAMKAASADYLLKRRAAYPTVEEQLDTIFHYGIDEWRARIQKIKDAIPKTVVTE